MSACPAPRCVASFRTRSRPEHEHARAHVRANGSAGGSVIRVGPPFEREREREHIHDTCYMVHAA